MVNPSQTAQLLNYQSEICALNKLKAQRQMAKTIKVIVTVTLLGLLLLLVSCGLVDDTDTKQQNGKNVGALPKLNKNGAGMTAKNVSHLQRQKLLRLHRQKRYLLFPEGSSFQIVFDLIIPIVDYTNFAIMGITCAVAWELPSKPPSELIENVRTRLNDGTLGVVRRNDSVPAANWQAFPVHPNQQTKGSRLQTLPPSNGYYTNGQREALSSVYTNANEQQPMVAANWHMRQSGMPLEQPEHWSAGNNWWERNKAQVEQNWREKQRIWQGLQVPAVRYAQLTGRQRKLLKQPPRHYIYPVFGKRRRRRRRSLDKDSAFEQLHQRLHLSSRQLLFRKIERLYQAQGLNGTSCVLRALCESGQRHGKASSTLQRPQSFIMELLSVIFQLPIRGTEAIDMLEHISPLYLAAHSSSGNCSQLFSECKHGFWFDKNN